MRTIKNGKEAIVSFAEGDEQRMMLMGLKRFTKYQNQPNVVALRNIIADMCQINNPLKKNLLGYFEHI